MKTSFKRMPRTIGYHFQILTKGFIKMLWGTITAALIGFAIYGYVMVPSEGGYAAVSAFLVSTFIMCVAVGGMYLMGGNGNKGAKK